MGTWRGMISQANHVAAPRVSVLMTIYNAGPYLRPAIDSLIAQTFPDWELIAVENGSTDQSMSVLKSYSDHRVRVFPLEKNIGRTPALRLAFEQARGEYIAILDADDISAPGRLARQVEFLECHPDVALVGSWVQFIDEHGKVFGELKPPVNQRELQDCLGWANPIVHSSAVYRHELAKQVGGYPENFIWGQDFALTLTLAQRARIAIVDDFLCQLRMLRTGMTRAKEFQLIVATENLMLFQRAGEALLLSKKAQRLNRRAIAIARIRLGVAILKNNSVLAGILMILRGFFATPSVLWGNGPVRRFFGAKF